MSSFLADTLVTAPQIILGGWILMRYIRSRHPVRHTAVFVLLSVLAYVFSGYVQMLALRVVLSIVIQVIMILLCTQIPHTHALLFVPLTILCMFVTELPADAIMYYLYPGFGFSANLPLSGVLIWKLAYLPAMALSYLLPYWFCRRFFQTEGDAEISKYLPFLAIQTILAPIPVVITTAYLADHSLTDHYVLLYVLCLLYLLANIGLDLLLMHTFGKINRAHALELREEQTRNMLQAQLDYYNQIQDNAVAIRQLRHDMNNQLRTLSILLENGEAETARAQLSSLREDISRTGKNRYTGNPVVDAVIEAKRHVCTEAGVPLQCSGSLPGDIGIKAMSLCSITANLLDNAIHACRALPPDRMPEIRFSVALKGDRLLFVCENPASDSARLSVTKPALHQEHGWGLSILEAIAAEHHGALQIQPQDHTVKVILWLTLEPGTARSFA